MWSPLIPAKVREAWAAGPLGQVLVTSGTGCIPVAQQSWEPGVCISWMLARISCCSLHISVHLHVCTSRQCPSDSGRKPFQSNGSCHLPYLTAPGKLDLRAPISSGPVAAHLPGGFPVGCPQRTPRVRTSPPQQLQAVANPAGRLPHKECSVSVILAKIPQSGFHPPKLG